jgi:DeoR/GlpR family transcriptional regulator of sugar metabolism
MDAKSARLSKKERWERILSRLNSDVTVRISSLAEQYGVTTETIRRDIDALTKQGLVSRTYGGAASRSLTREPDLLQRRSRNVPERERIAQYAVSLVEPGDVLMVDSGSTTYNFARALAAHPMDLTILTNSLPIAQALGGVAGFRVVLAPGLYSETENAVYGQETTNLLERFHANKAFIGAGGITERDVTDADAEACWIKRKMIARSDRSILLLDHSKFDKRLFDQVCPLADIADLVVDRSPSEAIERALRGLPTELHVARSRPPPV